MDLLNIFYKKKYLFPNQSHPNIQPPLLKEEDKYKD